MSFTSRKPVTLEDIDDSLIKVIDSLRISIERQNSQRQWLERIDARLAAIEAAVSAVPEGENPLVQMLRDLFKQGDDQTQQLTQILAGLALVLKADQAKS
jgi:hypothetical protein